MKSILIVLVKDSVMILENKIVEIVCNFEYFMILKESKF